MHCLMLNSLADVAEYKRLHCKDVSTQLNCWHPFQSPSCGLTLREMFCQTFCQRNPNKYQLGPPHFVSSKLKFIMSSFSLSIVDSVTEDSVVEFWQQFSMCDLAGGAIISSPSRSAWDSSSSVTTSNSKQEKQHC